MADAKPRRYGVPYQGSKNAFALKLVDALPAAEVFVDLFAGGCAVTHAAMLSGKYERFVANDITDSALWFYECVHGRGVPDDPVVSRERFFAEKEADPFVRLVYSFGFDQRSYLYSRECERLKLAGMRMVLEPDPHKRYHKYRAFMRTLMEPVSFKWLSKYQGKNLKAVERLEAVERLKAVESLEAVERLECFQGDYRDVPIPAGACVYADPPYAGTKGYTCEFDHAAFYAWCLAQPFPVWVSEYEMPDGFTCVKRFAHVSRMSPNSRAQVREGLWVQSQFAHLYKPAHEQTQLPLDGEPCSP